MTLRSLEFALVRRMTTRAAIFLPGIGLVESVQWLGLLKGDATGRRRDCCTVAGRALKQMPHIVRYLASAHPDHHAYSMRPRAVGRRAVTTKRRAGGCPIEGPSGHQDYRLLPGGTCQG